MNLIYILFFAASAMADGPSVYRIAVGQRFFGADQGNVGSCQSEAYVAALESAAGARGLNLRFSSQYTHSYTWRNEEVDTVGSHLIEDEDAAFLERIGPIAPLYMMPEDSEGLRPRQTGVRPKPSRIGIFDENFPSATNLGFGVTYMSMTPGYSNSGNIQHIKNLISQNEAVILSVQGAIMTHFDASTGMMDRDFARYNVTERSNHAIAVVGYDDSLYASSPEIVSTPGAFIVRNSWNDARDIRDTLTDSAWREGFRSKLSSQNMPGYFALPYAYVEYLTQHRIPNGGYSILSLDYGAYSSAYERAQEHYHTQLAPFICDKEGEARDDLDVFGNRVLAELRTSLATMGRAAPDSREYGEASRTITAILLNHTSHQGLHQNSRLFFAKLSSHDGHPEIDRVRQFYAGEFDSYYCGYRTNPVTAHVWPTANIMTSETLIEAIQHLSIDPTSLLGWGMFLRGLL